MQQAATYSNLSRSTTSNSSQTSKSNHSATPSTSTIQSRQSSTPSSISHAGSIQSLPAVTSDLHDEAAHTTSARKPTSESARRKRPVFLALQPDESNGTVVEGRDVHTKRRRDQLRRSSPTVGQNFRFVPGEPPMSSLPPPPSSKDAQTTQACREETDVLHEERPHSSTFPLEPLSSPPTAPLPKPPSRSPSRSISPPKAPKIPARAPSRATRMKSHNGYMDRHPVSAPSSHQVTPLEEEPEQQPDPEKEQPVVSEEEVKIVEESPEAGNGRSQPATPPAEEQAISQTPGSSFLEPRKQKSSSNMRSLIIGLPEAARLRKEASAEALRKQPSVERLYSRSKIEEPVPALPMTEVAGFVRGNAFGWQSHTSMSSPPRTWSREGLSEQNRKRSATDLGNDPQMYSLPLRAQRGVGRAASDARRPSHLRFPAPQRMDDGNRLSPPTSASLSSPSSSYGSPLSQESWPLTPEGGHTSDYSHIRNDALQQTTQYLQPGDDHSRNASSERSFAPSESTNRTLSPDPTPRASQSSTPYSSTPRTGRSRNNTAMTINSEAGAGEMVDDSVSTAGSVAPSVMSAQWFRTPRERLGLGTRMSRAEALPWEEMDIPYEESGPPVPPKPRSPPAKTSRKFSVFPPRAPSRMLEKDERFNESPPRSPLLTQSFLSDVQTTLPQERPTKLHDIDDPPRPGTSMKDREGASTPDWSRTKSTTSMKEQKEEKKKKRKENSRFPTLGDIVKEYKAMTALRYNSTYAQAAEEQRIEKEIREGKRPETSSTISTRIGAAASLDLRDSSPIMTGSNGDRTKSLRTLHSKLRPRPSTDSFNSHAGTINDFSSQRMDSLERAKADKKRRKDRKKSSAFPTVKEMWSEYKKNADNWYTGAYQEEETRNVATPHSQFS